MRFFDAKLFMKSNKYEQFSGDFINIRKGLWLDKYKMKSFYFENQKVKLLNFFSIDFCKKKDEISRF
jgi:hypothetical protein